MSSGSWIDRRPWKCLNRIPAFSATVEDIRELKEDEATTHRALDLLNSTRNDDNEAALAALRDDTRESWVEVFARDPDELEGEEEPATTNAECMRRFLEREVLPWYVTRNKELANRRCSASRHSTRPSIATSWIGSDVTRCIATASPNAPSPC